MHRSTLPHILGFVFLCVYSLLILGIATERYVNSAEVCVSHGNQSLGYEVDGAQKLCGFAMLVVAIIAAFFVPFILLNGFLIFFMGIGLGYVLQRKTIAELKQLFFHSIKENKEFILPLSIVYTAYIILIMVKLLQVTSD